MPTEINIHDPVRRMKFEDGAVLDDELESLKLILEPFQAALDRIKTVSDPESCGYLDTAEYFVGVAMVAVQKYLSSSCRAEGVSKQIGLKIGPKHESGEFVVALLNKLANAWKHRDEWDWEDNPDPTKAEARLSRQRDSTAVVFDLLEDDEHWYPYSNVVYHVLGDVSASKLVDVLVEWRDALELEGATTRV